MGRDGPATSPAPRLRGSPPFPGQDPSPPELALPSCRREPGARVGGEWSRPWRPLLPATSRPGSACSACCSPHAGARYPRCPPWDHRRQEASPARQPLPHQRPSQGQDRGLQPEAAAAPRGSPQGAEGWGCSESGDGGHRLARGGTRESHLRGCGWTWACPSAPWHGPEQPRSSVPQAPGV